MMTIPSPGIFYMVLLKAATLWAGQAVADASGIGDDRRGLCPHDPTDRPLWGPDGA